MFYSESHLSFDTIISSRRIITITERHANAEQLRHDRARAARHLQVHEEPVHVRAAHGRVRHRHFNLSGASAHICRDRSVSGELASLAARRYPTRLQGLGRPSCLECGLLPNPQRRQCREYVSHKHAKSNSF